MLFALTGLDVQENQARRLLDDIASFRGWLEQVERPAGARGGGGQPVADRGLRARWSTAIPPDLRGRLDEAEIFHEILEHRWFLSEAAGRDVGTDGRGQGLLRAACCPRCPRTW